MPCENLTNYNDRCLVVVRSLKVEGSVVETIQKLVEHKIDVFGLAGKA